jgi:hypothetical protein
MVAAVTASLDPHPLPRGLGELPYHLRRDRLAPRTFKQRLRTLCVGLGLISDRLETLRSVDAMAAKGLIGAARSSPIAAAGGDAKRQA